MNLSRYSYAITLFALLLIVGCSGNNNSPVVPDSTTDLPDADTISSTTGLFGAYELTINPEDLTAELIPKRSLNIGESLMVNGLVYFIKTPCFNCFRLKSFKWVSDGLNLIFEVEHPLPEGNTGLPPSAANRLDLDVFDLAAVIRPSGVTPTVFPLSFLKTYSDIIRNPDGYTNELDNIITADDELLPYILVVDDSDTGTSTWNIFEMGSTHEFDVELLNYDDLLTFDIYLTFAYGVSATYKTRFEPKYYNPEFNRKAAWKVDVQPLGAWNHNDDSSTVNVQVSVYDWQIGATVSTEPNFANADPDHVYASSEPQTVSVEISGMTNAIKTVNGNSFSSGTGMPNNPLIYNILVANENLLPVGEYPGLVKILDERPTLLPADNRDILIDSLDGIQLDKYEIIEYATYQTFTANVLEGCNGYCWTKTWGGTLYDMALSVSLDQAGNTYVTGRFNVTVDFNPDGGGTQSSNGGHDAFLSKFDSSGNWLWTNTWGGTGDDCAWTVILDQAGNPYVAGYFVGTVDFNPGGSGGTRLSHGIDDAFLSKFDSSGNWQWTKTWGGMDVDRAMSVCIDQTGSPLVTGYFTGSVEFNPNGGGTLSSNGVNDVFLSKFYPSGNWQWTRKWGGSETDKGYGVSLDQADNIFVTGLFMDTVNFNPDGGGTKSSNGNNDVFLSKFNSSGLWQWTKTWGGSDYDESRSVSLDLNGNAYVVGAFTGTADFNPDGGGSHTSNGSYDAFLSKFNSSGNWQWAKTWGGTDTEMSYSVSPDQTGNIFVTGSFEETVSFNPDGGGSRSSHGGEDAFLSKFNSSGTWQWTKTWGGTDYDRGMSVALDYAGNALVTGYFQDSVDFNPDGGDTQSSDGTYDIFLWKGNY